MLSDIKVDDVVTRNLVGVLMKLTVTEVTDDRIKCGSWEFNKKTGYEIDEELGWDGVTRTGSYIKPLSPTTESKQQKEE